MSGTADTATAWSPRDFLAKVVGPAIAALPLDEADQGETVPVLRLLLLGTALQESLLRHVDQLPNRDGSRGPALGYFQMEPATHDDIWANYLAYRPALAAQVRAVAGIAAGRPEAKLLRTHHVYAAVMARLLYRRVKGRLPQAAEVPALAAYWKAHYNTALGKGKAIEFEEKLAAVLDRL
jgi:hypothetical protein